MKKKLLAGSAIIIFLATWTGFAEASFAFTHSGATDPTTEGFGVWASIGSTTVGPVHDDNGYEAWSITGLTQFQQYAYYSGPLNANQQSDIDNQGFVLNVVERVKQGIAPVYSPANPAVTGVVSVSTGSQRFDIDLGVDSNGNTVVVLPDSAYYSGSTVVTPGTSYTLTNSSSSYHTYQLIYDPSTQLADLFVDGIERIQNYAGFAYPSTPFYSLLFSGTNGGQANFSSVKFTSSPVPLPGAAWLFGSALVGLISFTRCKSQDS